MKHVCVASHFSFCAQLLSAVNQSAGAAKKNIPDSLRVGIIFAKLISVKKFTEATVSIKTCEAVLDGGDLYNGPSVMCQSTFL